MEGIQTQMLRLWKLREGDLGRFDAFAKRIFREPTERRKQQKREGSIGAEAQKQLVSTW